MPGGLKEKEGQGQRGLCQLYKKGKQWLHSRVGRFWNLLFLYGIRPLQRLWEHLVGIDSGIHICHCRIHYFNPECLQGQTEKQLPEPFPEIDGVQHGFQ